MLDDEVKETIYLSDAALYKTYTSGSQYKTNLLGLDPGCDRKYKTFPVTGKIDPKEFRLSDIQQGYLANCSFISVLRTIMRRHPQVFLNMIKDFDEKHIVIKLYTENEGRPIPITYKIDKTIVMPAYNCCGSLLNTIRFFAFSPSKNEKPWVKLIEKALVLHLMRISYPLNLENIQHHGHHFTYEEGKGVIPSYEDVISVLKDTYFTLLGCQMAHESFYEMSQPRNIIKKNFINGELTTVKFFPNQLGLEENHSYELVDFAKSKNKKFVILSNPWGFNQKESKYNTKNIDILSLKLLSNYSPEQIKSDKGIIILPIKDFYKTVQGCHMTIKLTNSFSQDEKMKFLAQQTPTPPSAHKTVPQFYKKSFYSQFFKSAAMVGVGSYCLVNYGAGTAITSAGLFYFPEIFKKLRSSCESHLRGSIPAFST